MKQPLIQRKRVLSREHGVTMVLVALAMVAIIAMAALSIDVITLYLAREEAQRSADTAALAAVRIISLSGITGDPANTASYWAAVCGGTTSPATQAANTVALQNLVGGAAANTVNVTYSAGGSSGADCSKLPVWPGGTFGVNPSVTVQVIRTNLPNFFSRIWGRAGNSVSATSSAEAFNSSFSGALMGSILPVQPTCVKPWIVPNRDPWTLGSQSGPYCDQNQFGQRDCNAIVNTADGTISHQGISLNGANTQGIIGETFWLNADCRYRNSTCQLRATPEANYSSGSIHVEPAPSLFYIPGQILTNAAAVPSCAAGSTYESAVSGCDQSTIYQCGVPDANAVDLSENPAFSGDTTDAVQCLINQGDTSNISQSSGQDTLNPFGAPSAYPFLIFAGSANPLVATGLSKDTPLTTSPSIVSLPIYDDLGRTKVIGPGVTQVTIIGFLQVFINAVDPYGNVLVTVLNVVGCSNGSGTTYSVAGSPVTGNSPVPTRIVTTP